MPYTEPVLWNHEHFVDVITFMELEGPVPDLAWYENRPVERLDRVWPEAQRRGLV